jgi:hypothetical protein
VSLIRGSSACGSHMPSYPTLVMAQPNPFASDTATG